MRRRHFGYQDKVLLLQHGCTELLALAQRRGAALHKLLSGSSIFAQDLHKPLGRLHHTDWLMLLQNCRQQVNSPELPYLLGSALLNSRYISLCQSLQYAKNLRQALKQLYYFRHQLFPCFYARLYQQQHCIVLEFKPALGLANQQAFMLTALCALLLGLIKQQLGTLDGISLQLQQSAESPALQQQLFGGINLSFNQVADSISIPLALWQQEFNHANAAEFNAARRTCRQLNRVLPPQRALPERICRLQRRALPQLLSQEQVAAALGLSSSSLKRQLSQHQTNFAGLLDEVRRDAAQQLLQQGHYSNRQLALKLGYSDEHNFRRAFKRWTGLIPSSFKGLFNFN
ncbi:helix-turn-helix transcriptional regulator [Rheinheimera maricola]|uniref:Helix-turn-helix transcriptional regulator n=1 Tax=Rheinheimera maricola TaxID=2793282 RepID=A0ABS7XBH5_9GAMM|nr:helix-turn-helix transcriptional regulator [Rheinheimera maricola]MBZ9612892.1 helix-turn-helix transcriptional regulator [Rheinheimera maricola]